jgi:ribosomal-protein-alanine N-acetyltransferase
MEIRQAKLSDVPAISRIEVESFDSPWSAKEITKDVMAGGGIDFVVAVDGSECLGFAEMRCVAGEAQIYNIAVAPEARGRGVGEALFRDLIDKAEARGCDTVNLEVRAGNEAALGLYEKLGFREVGRRSKYYDGKEDAILMDLDLRTMEIEVEVQL